MLRKFSLVFVAMCLAVSVFAGLLLTGDPQIWAITASVLFTMFIPAASPGVAAYLAGRSRLMLVLGIGLAGVGVVAMVAAIVLRPDDYSERAIGLSIWPMLAGAAIAYLPFMSRQMNRAWADLDEVRRSPPISPPKFSPTGDVAEALRLLVEERLALGWAVGPWLLLFCLLPLAFVNLAFWKELARQQAGLALIGLLVFFVVFVCLPLVAAIRWARFLATGQRPQLLGMPLGALWSFAWRLFFAGIVLRLINGAEPWLKGHLPSAAPWMTSGLAELFSLLVLVLASPWAMVFVAVAIGAQDKSTAGALKAARSVGRRFYLGMLLILSPIVLFSWLTGLAPTTADIGIQELLIYFGWSLALFVTLIVATTYLTRIYLRGSPNSMASAAV